MNNALQTFSFQSLPLRVEVDEQGNPWFCAKDACDILGHTNSSKAIKDHCKPKGVTNKYPLQTTGGIQYPTFIDEGNLYRLIIKSHKPEAEPFESLVCDEILPAIRKTGGYIAPNTEAQKLMEIKDQLLDSQKQLLASEKYSHEAFKEKANAYIAHLVKQNEQLNFRANINAESNKRNREELARAVRAQRPIAAAEEKEIFDMYDQGWTVRNLACWFYRNAAIIRRSIRNQGGTV